MGGKSPSKRQVVTCEVFLNIIHLVCMIIKTCHTIDNLNAVLPENVKA